MTPPGMRAVLSEAVLIYFATVILASALRGPMVRGVKADTTGGVFRVCEDEPAPQIGVELHRTP
jgi:hypothetical protein